MKPNSAVDLRADAEADTTVGARTTSFSGIIILVFDSKVSGVVKTVDEGLVSVALSGQSTSGSGRVVLMSATVVSFGSRVWTSGMWLCLAVGPANLIGSGLVMVGSRLVVEPMNGMTT